MGLQLLTFIVLYLFGLFTDCDARPFWIQHQGGAGTWLASSAEAAADSQSYSTQVLAKWRLGDAAASLHGDTSLEGTPLKERACQEGFEQAVRRDGQAMAMRMWTDMQGFSSVLPTVRDEVGSGPLCSADRAIRTMALEDPSMAAASLTKGQGKPVGEGTSLSETKTAPKGSAEGQDGAGNAGCRQGWWIWQWVSHHRSATTTARTTSADGGHARVALDTGHRLDGFGGDRQASACFQRAHAGTFQPQGGPAAECASDVRVPHGSQPQDRSQSNASSGPRRWSSRV